MEISHKMNPLSYVSTDNSSILTDSFRKLATTCSVMLQSGPSSSDSGVYQPQSVPLPIRLSPSSPSLMKKEAAAVDDLSSHYSQSCSSISVLTQQKCKRSGQNRCIADRRFLSFPKCLPDSSPPASSPTDDVAVIHSNEISFGRQRPIHTGSDCLRNPLLRSTLTKSYPPFPQG